MTDRTGERRRVPIGLLYALFALLAMGTNLGTQALTLSLYDGPFSIYVALVAGTGAGLFLKYALDRRFVFEYKPTGHVDNAKKFLAYSSLSVITTAIFWGAELGFHALIGTEWAKYVGGAIGLAIGYTTKFFLDRHLVFRVRRR